MGTWMNESTHTHRAYSPNQANDGATPSVEKLYQIVNPPARMNMQSDFIENQSLYRSHSNQFGLEHCPEMRRRLYKFLNYSHDKSVRY